MPSRPSWTWALGFTGAVVLVFGLYQWVLPNTNSQVQGFFNSWLPLTSPSC